MARKENRGGGKSCEGGNPKKGNREGLIQSNVKGGLLKRIRGGHPCQNENLGKRQLIPLIITAPRWRSLIREGEGPFKKLIG